MCDSTVTAKDFPLHTTVGVSALVEMNIEDLKVNFPSPYFNSYHREVTNPNPVFLWDEAELKGEAPPQVGHQLMDHEIWQQLFCSSCSALMGAYKSQICPFCQTSSQLPDIFESGQSLKNQHSSFFGSPSPHVVGRGCQRDLSDLIYFLHYASLLEYASSYIGV